MTSDDKVNILLVDDQPAKLLSYETILSELGENLIKAASAREALEQLLKQDIAVILVDVCMPELDGFQLAAMIREHPRFQQTAIIFISAIHLTDVDRLRAYEMGAVDYVPVPVIPEVLRAKVRIFAELYRKTRQLEQLNRELERRVAERTARAGGLERTAGAKRAAPQPCAGRRADGIVGMGSASMATFPGTMGSIASSGSIRRASSSPSRIFASSSIPTIGSTCRTRSSRRRRARPPSRPSFAFAVRMERCAGASAQRWRASMPPTTSFASAA